MRADPEDVQQRDIDNRGHGRGGQKASAGKGHARFLQGVVVGGIGFHLPIEVNRAEVNRSEAV